MRVTRLGLKGILFYMLLIAAFFAAPYLNLFFLLLSFCSAIAVLSIWWAHRNLTGVRGRLDEIPPAPAGASQLAHGTLSCRSRTRRDLVFEVEAAGSCHIIHPGFELQPGDEQRIDVTIPALSRGVHPVRGVRVRSQFPIGLMESSRALAGPETITVYPSPADLARFRERGGAAGQGLGGVDTTEMGPSGLREYRVGDELRNVHWKASARRADLVVKEREGDAAPGVEVLLDLRVRGERFEESLSLISALALECKANKELFTLYTQEHRGTYGKGHGSFDTLLAYLAGAQPLPSSAAPPPTVSPAVLRLPLAHRLDHRPDHRPAPAANPASQPADTPTGRPAGRGTPC